MIKEYDRIYLLQNLTDTPFVKGDVGTIVFLYPENTGYEVEFFSFDGTSLGVETVKADMVKSVVGIKKVLHVDEAA